MASPSLRAPPANSKPHLHHRPAHSAVQAPHCTLLVLLRQEEQPLLLRPREPPRAQLPPAAAAAAHAAQVRAQPQQRVQVQAQPLVQAPLLVQQQRQVLGAPPLVQGQELVLLLGQPPPVQGLGPQGQQLAEVVQVQVLAGSQLPELLLARRLPLLPVLLMRPLRPPLLAPLQLLPECHWLRVSSLQSTEGMGFRRRKRAITCGPLNHEQLHAWGRGAKARACM